MACGVSPAVHDKRLRRSSNLCRLSAPSGGRSRWAAAPGGGPGRRRARGSLGAMDLTSVIDTRPGVRSGKPCFIGTRIAVYDVLDYLASGMTSDEIVHDFPELTEGHVRAAIEFAAMRERRLAAPA